MSFETDVMDDLFYDEAEGSAGAFDEFDEFDEGDEFLGGIIRGVGSLIGGGSQFDEYDEYDEAMDMGDEELMDAMEDAVVDALEAEDADEFFRRLARGVRGIARRVAPIARTIGRGIRRAAPIVGRIARTVAPVASLIPGVGTAVGTAANVLGSVLPADEFDVMDDILDYMEEDEDALYAAAPIVAGLTIRRTMPGVSRMPRPARKQMVRSVTQATRTMARKQGAQAARAVPGVVRAVQQGVRQRRIPPRAAPQAIQRAAQRVARSPQAVRRLARATPAGAMAMGGTVAMRRPGGVACPTCRRRQRYTLRGPVTISIQGQ